jgi:urea transporter
MAPRKAAYFAMMGSAVALFVLAWAVVRLYSTVAAGLMCLVALLLVPLAVIVGNRSD